MKYNPSTPLFYMHIPKCGGSVVRTILRRECGARHVDDHIYEPKEIAREDRIILSSHYDREKNGAIEKVRPTATQFTAVLRDPFDFALSMYFYWKNTWHGSMAYGKGRKWLLSDYGKDAAEFVMNCPFAFTDFLPPAEDASILDDFVLVGVLDHLQEYVNELSRLIGIASVEVWKGNPSVYDEPVPNEIREEYARKNEVDYALFARAVEIVRERIEEKRA